MTGGPPLADVLVVGGGPAGLSAATWAARYRRSVLVVDRGQYRNRWASKSHGYLGNDPGDPMELLDRARTDLGRYPEVSFCEGEATGARRAADGRFVVTVDGEDYPGLRLILATGVVDEFPEIDGFSTTTARASSTAPPATAMRRRAARS